LAVKWCLLRKILFEIYSLWFTLPKTSYESSSFEQNYPFIPDEK